MKRVLLLALALCLGVSTAGSYWQSRSQVGVGGAAAYSGPGDIVGAARVWWGLRGYNAAFSGAIANICDTATGAVCADATWSGGTLTLPTIGGLVCGVGVTCNVKTLYDQTGNGINATQATNANRPALTINCVSTLPCMTFSGSQRLVSGNVVGNQPLTISTVANLTGSPSGSPRAVEIGNIAIALGWGPSANSPFVYAGTVLASSATDGSFHAMQGIVNGGSSTLYIDGSATNGNAGAAADTNIVNIGDCFPNTCGLTGNITEVGIWGAAFTGGQQSSMNSNQHSYWGF